MRRQPRELVRYKGQTCLVLRRLGGLVHIRMPFGEDRTVPARECEPAQVALARPGEPEYWGCKD